MFKTMISGYKFSLSCYNARKVRFFKTDGTASNLRIFVLLKLHSRHEVKQSLGIAFLYITSCINKGMGRGLSLVPL